MKIRKYENTKIRKYENMKYKIQNRKYKKYKKYKNTNNYIKLYYNN